jgi:hypothetical protein
MLVGGHGLRKHPKRHVDEEFEEQADQQQEEEEEEEVAPTSKQGTSRGGKKKTAGKAAKQRQQKAQQKEAVSVEDTMVVGGHGLRKHPKRHEVQDIDADEEAVTAGRGRRKGGRQQQEEEEEEGGEEQEEEEEEEPAPPPTPAVKRRRWVPAGSWQELMPCTLVLFCPVVLLSIQQPGWNCDPVHAHTGCISEALQPLQCQVLVDDDYLPPDALIHA